MNITDMKQLIDLVNQFGREHCDPEDESGLAKVAALVVEVRAEAARLSQLDEIPDPPVVQRHTLVPNGRYDSDGDPIMTCPSASHALVADANACAFNQMWRKACERQGV